jgi:hypothetical protein
VPSLSQQIIIHTGTEIAVLDYRFITGESINIKIKQDNMLNLDTGYNYWQL